MMQNRSDSMKKPHRPKRSGVIAALIVFCVVLVGCDTNTTDKNKVFKRWFQVSAPTNANIIAGSYSAQRIGPMLDGEELILDVELPHDFLDKNLPHFPNAPQQLEQEKLRELIGGALMMGVCQEKEALASALEGCPVWFKPIDPLQFLITAPKTNYATVSFLDSNPTNRFQLWLWNYGRCKVFIDRKSGHIYVHYKRVY